MSGLIKICLLLKQKTNSKKLVFISADISYALNRTARDLTEKRGKRFVRGSRSSLCHLKNLVFIQHRVHSGVCVHSGSHPFGIVSFPVCAHSGMHPFEIVPFGIVSIWDCVHFGLCSFGIVSIRDYVNSGLCPFGIVYIRNCVHRELCSFDIVSIWAIVRKTK